MIKVAVKIKTKVKAIAKVGTKIVIDPSPDWVYGGESFA